MNKAMFGAGCFWGVEELFRTTHGVTQTKVGYSGGKTENPTYHEVCNDDTGHAEVVYLEFDESKINYEKLLELFFKNHNPTTLNYQGPDYGSQYRSVIFYYNDEQKEKAENFKKSLEKSGRYLNPIVTQIVPAEKFWPAEDYHQKYLMKKGLRNCHL